jgi:Zn finger protein HypA/HybF involved in hydrogenase expression
VADERRLDGNAVGGVLLELFGIEMTTVTGVCNACGAHEPMARTDVYLNAPGIVIRCAHCQAIQLTIVRGPERTWLSLTGLRSLELPG